MFTKWLTGFWNLRTKANEPLSVGTRVRTKHGIGTVVNAMVSVDLEPGSKLRQSKLSPRVNITMPVSGVEIED